MVAASSIQWCRVAWDGWMDAVNKLRRVFFCLRNEKSYFLQWSTFFNDFSQYTS